MLLEGLSGKEADLALLACIPARITFDRHGQSLARLSLSVHRYTCGALLHNSELIVPHGLANHATCFATVPLAEVLAAMEQEEPVSV